MNPIRGPLFLCFYLLLSLSSSEAQVIAAKNSKAVFQLHSDQQIKERLRNISNDLLDHRFNPTVRSYVQTYTVRNRKRCEEMLGKMPLYFPLFERELAAANLPLDLKYLAIVESALDPNARSRSGAVGLWQFMPATAKDFNLRIRSTIDDRKDPAKATKAAVKYLGWLYEKFGSWELALAAYNGGPGRVSKAVRRAGTKDYWSLKKYIPKETRNYVSAYIGASYVANFYHLHDLNPKYVDNKLLNTTSISVTEGLSFSKISKKTGLSTKVIKQLNPQYLKNTIPSYSNGYPLVLPSLEAEIIRNAYTAVPRHNYHLERWNKKNDFQQIDYQVIPGDNLNSIASMFKCSTEDIVKWNRLTSTTIYSGKRLVLFSKKKARKPRFWNVSPLVAKKATSKIDNPSRFVDIKVTEHHTLIVGEFDRRNPRVIKKGKDRYYILKRGESLSDVARQFSKLSLKDLLTLNGIKINDRLSPGQKLKIK